MTRNGWISARLEGHTRQVNSVSISPSGDLILSTADDGTVKLWGEDGSGSWAHHSLNYVPSAYSATNRIFDGQFSNSSNDVLTRSGDGQINVWNISGFKNWEDSIHKSKLYNPSVEFACRALTSKFIYEISPELPSKYRKVPMSTMQRYDITKVPSGFSIVDHSSTDVCGETQSSLIEQLFMFMVPPKYWSGFK